MRVVHYARVSTEHQAQRGYSVEGQLADLREHAEREGYEIVEEVVDPAQKRSTLQRPGIDRIRELAEAGQIEQVWAWRWDRFGESPWPEVLAIELEEYDVTLRSLDDGGEGEDADILRALRGAMAKKERRRTAERSKMGVIQKARMGELVGGAGAPRYGFRFTKNAAGKNAGYRVEPQEMANVRLILGMLADGESIRGVETRLEQSGVKAPRGGWMWSRTTIKNLALEDVYRPHSVAELDGLLTPEVLAGLDPERVYGIVWFGKRRSRKARNGPAESLIAIPVDLTDAGLERAVVDRAREQVKDNRAPAKLDGRAWELSGGILRCGKCGRAMSPYKRASRADGTARHYYRCQPNSSARMRGRLCANRRSHPADALEHDAVAVFQQYANREALLALYDRAIEEQNSRTGLRDRLQRRAALSERLSDLELERRGYLRQNARGVLSDAELDAMLAEIDEQRQEITAELRAIEDAEGASRQIEAVRYWLVHAQWEEDPDAIMPGEYLSLAASPDEIRRAYRRFGASFTISEDGALTLRLALGLGGESLEIERTPRRDGLWRRAARLSY